MRIVRRRSNQILGAMMKFNLKNRPQTQEKNISKSKRTVKRPRFFLRHFYELKNNFKRTRYVQKSNSCFRKRQRANWVSCSSGHVFFFCFFPHCPSGARRRRSTAAAAVSFASTERQLLRLLETSAGRNIEIATGRRL